MLKAVLAGVGGISSAHIPGWRVLEDVRLAAICDIRPEQMEKYLLRRREENRNYAPKAYQALCDALVEQKGLVLVLISGGDAETETAAILAGE